MAPSVKVEIGFSTVVPLEMAVVASVLRMIGGVSLLVSGLGIYDRDADFCGRKDAGDRD